MRARVKGLMGSKGRDAGQKLVAIIVILAMLALMGIPPTVIIFFATVVYFVWRAVDRSEQHETRRIFDFYLAANEILREDERRWFGFEITEVIGQGEAVVHSMADAPPLAHFALGALYQRAGDHDAAVEHLAHVVEAEAGDEQQCISPSPELRRYVACCAVPNATRRRAAGARRRRILERTRRRAQVPRCRRESQTQRPPKLDATNAARDLYAGAALPLRRRCHASFAARRNTNAPHPRLAPPKARADLRSPARLYEEEKKTAVRAVRCQCQLSVVCGHRANCRRLS